MPEPLKNRIGRPEVELIENRIRSVFSEYPHGALSAIAPELEVLELKDRVAAVAGRLHQTLPMAYPAALSIVVQAAATGIDGFAAWPLCTFVERHGVDYPTESLVAMESLTQSWSCEFAIRPFLESHFQETMAAVHRWVDSDKADVRRLASEGTRPRLPWGPRVKALSEDFTIGLAVLEQLRHDPSEMVRRSVANHLNDIAKDDPALVVKTVSAWAKEPEIDVRMISHALRSLVKLGDLGALAVLGFTTDAAVDVVSFGISPASVRLGDTVELQAVLQSRSATAQRLVIDFVIHHPSATGSTSSKVFKWATVELASGAESALTKKRKIATASTRKYTAGRHQVDLQVAGSVVATTEFTLLNSSPPSSVPPAERSEASGGKGPDPEGVG